jgi:hypothetical protein
MKSIFFNEENEICKVKLNNYKYNKIKQVDSYNGVYDIQEEISFLPHNYNELKLFLIKSGREINFIIYGDEDKLSLYLPHIEFDDEKQKITLIKLNTYYF